MRRVLFLPQDRGRLRVLLEQLERAAPSLEELKWSNAARVTKVARVQHVLRGPELARLKTLWERWKATYKSLPNHAKKLARPNEADCAYLRAVEHFANWLRHEEGQGLAEEEAMEAALALVKAGFNEWRDLEGAAEGSVGARQGIAAATEAVVNRAIRRANAAASEERQGVKRPREDEKSVVSVMADIQRERIVTEQGVANKRPWPEQVGTSLGPMASCSALAKVVHDGLSPVVFTEQVLFDNVIQSAEKSLPSKISGLKCWAAFADQVLRLKGAHLPPTPEGLAAWSRLFHNSKVFGNYLAAVKFACELRRLPTSAFNDEAIKRAKAAIARREPPPRGKAFIRQSLTLRLMQLAESEQDKQGSMLYGICYTFLLRVRNEGLPLVSGIVGGPDRPLPPQRHSGIGISGHELILQLASRKNKPHGSTLKRRCCCSSCPAMCPVHILGPWIQSHPAGTQLFSNIDGDFALKVLRRRLSALGIEDAARYRLHDFRRGHAQDLFESGANLKTIVLAGE